MNNVFEKLNEFIHYHAHPAALNDPAQNRLAKEELLRHASNLQVEFTNTVLRVTRPKSLAVLVQIAKSTVCILLNRLIAYREEMPDEFYDQMEQHMVDFLHFLRTHYPSHFAGDTITPVRAERIEVDLSVAQLGVFIWLLVDTGIIRTNNISGLIRNIAANIRTTKTASISAENLYKHFYTRQPAASSILHSILRNMQTKLHSYLLPALLGFNKVTASLLLAFCEEPYLALI